MSLVHLAHVCSHLTNASKARLSITSVPNTKLHRALFLALRDAGFVSSVVLGGPNPPVPHSLLNQPSITDIKVPPEPVTRENVASRRLWLGLKYWQSEPVISKMTVISKPTKRICLDLPALRRIVRGNMSDTVYGIRSPGECIFLTTSDGIFEARECVERKIGGMALCRVI
ncbi:hypothetical protein PRK78_005153 [Emydomyces testavorans]|uniref:Small ribosomal subunit protein uS8m n=1 Tax=Emydomyces testavorans TaxID=2070801 RepID=A0AAF0DJY7_9EURO|nr:hypothetical protein PRK78_005153 [Emydomyces testavorans]